MTIDCRVRSVPARLVAVLCVGVFVAAACGGGGEPAPAPAAEEPVVAEESLKLYVFECGRLRFDTVERFSIADDETDVRELIVPCYVVDHPAGTLLWDGGLPSAAAETEGWSDSGQRLDRTFAEQLAEYDLGVDLGSFDYVAFSHIHFDHVGVAGELTGGPGWCSRGIWTRRSRRGSAPRRPSRCWTTCGTSSGWSWTATTTCSATAACRSSRRRAIRRGTRCCFWISPRPGRWCCPGDLYHFRLSREERRVPTFNFDAEMTLESMEKVEAFVAERNATFWIEHDLALFETLQTAPAFYE